MRAIFLLFLGISFASAQYFPVFEYQTFFGGEGKDVAEKICKVGEGQLILAGTTYDGEDSDVSILKVNEIGDVIWGKTIGKEGKQVLKGIAPYNGGVIVLANSNTMLKENENSSQGLGADIWLFCLDKNGEMVWTKTLGGSGIDLGMDIACDKENCWVVGESFSADGQANQNFGAGDIWIMQIKPFDGDFLLSKIIGDKRTEWADAVSICKNGDIVLTGTTYSEQLETVSGEISEPSVFVAKIKKRGALSWIKTFPIPHGGKLYDVQEDLYGNIVACGAYYPSPDQSDFWILHLDAQGNQLAEKKWGTSYPEKMNALAVTRDSAYIFTGTSVCNKTVDEYYKGRDDFWIFRTSMTFEPIWKKTYGGPNRESAADIVEVGENNYFALATKENFFEETEKKEDFWLLHISESTCDSLEVGIFVRTNEQYEVPLNQPVRFRARAPQAERFLWDFGDETTSTEEQPLKVYKQEGEYIITLTVFINEGCTITTYFPETIQVKK